MLRSVMASRNQILILKLITYACTYFFWNSRSIEAVHIDRCQYQRYVPNNYYSCYCNQVGLRTPCGGEITKLTEPFTVGEGPFWSTKTKSLYLVDAANGTICRYAVHTRELFCAKLGDQSVQFINPVAGLPNKFVTSYGSHLAVVTWDGTSTVATFESIGQPDPDPGNFVNEGKADSLGHLFFITEPKVPPTGLGLIPPNRSRLWNIIDCEQKALVSDLTFGNGIGFCPDETCIFYSDSVTNHTCEAPYDRTTNSIIEHRQRILVDYTKCGIPCFPDSMTVDAEGYIWSTCNRYYRVLKIDPYTGCIKCSIKLDAVAPTNVAFGECYGESNGILSCLYVTSERIRLSSPKPADGCMFVVRNTGSKGCPPNEVNPKGTYMCT